MKSESDTPTILRRIISRKKEEVRERSGILALPDLKKQVDGCPPARGFAAAINRHLGVGDAAVIAEIKKASPSQGVIRPNFNPSSIAQSYARAGAACLSVLTDIDFFQGNDDDLKTARKAAGLPVLRKDFMIDEWQIWESRMLGADCILLIAAALSGDQLIEYAEIASKLGMDVLIEVHNQDELKLALNVNCPLIGINNRNLHTFEVDLKTTFELAAQIPNNRIIVTESGIHQREDVKKLRREGIHTFLVGERFMRSEDPGSALQELFTDTGTRQ